MSKHRQVDLVAATAAALILIMTVVYLVVMHQQGNQPLVWVLIVLLGGAVLTGYGARIASRHRRVALLWAGMVMTVLGFLAIFSIGYPLLAAGVLCLVAASRAK